MPGQHATFWWLSVSSHGKSNHLTASKMAKYNRKGLWSSFQKTKFFLVQQSLLIKLFWIGILAFWHFGSGHLSIHSRAGRQVNFLQPCKPRLGNPTICKAFSINLFYGFNSFCIVLGFPWLHCLGLKMVVISSLPSFSVQHPEIQTLPSQHKMVFERHIYVELEKVLHLNKIRVSV